MDEDDDGDETDDGMGDYDSRIEVSDANLRLMYEVRSYFNKNIFNMFCFGCTCDIVITSASNHTIYITYSIIMFYFPKRFDKIRNLNNSEIFITGFARTIHRVY